MKYCPVFLAALLLAGCSNVPRMTVAEFTVIGLHATPGDGSSKPPQVTFAYKRSELALVPTNEKPAQQTNSDCYSSLTALYYKGQFFGPTIIDDFIATGFAARTLATSEFFGTSVATSIQTNRPAVGASGIR
jgi:hypothetical protein